MENTVSLYRMELRKNRSFFFIILAVQLVLISAKLAVKITQYVNGNSLDPYNVLPISEFLILVTFNAFPLMLLYSWHRDEREKTSYQMLSFPVRSHVVLKNKLAAFLSIGTVWVAFYTLVLSAIGWMRFSNSSYATFGYSTVLRMFMHYFSIMLLLLGFTCLVISILQVIKQRRLLAGTGFIMVGVTVYLFLQHRYVSFLHGVYGKITWVARTTTDPHIRILELIDGHREIMFLIRTAHSFLPLLIGIACMYTGFFLFDRYSEI